MLTQKADPVHRLLKAAGIMAQFRISLIICPVERDIHPPGLILSQERCQFLIDQSPVRVDRKDHSHLPQSKVKFPELRKEERLPSCQQQEEHSRLLHLPADLQPLVRSPEPSLPLHLLAAEPDIAHITVHVAQRKKFDTSVGRRPCAFRLV